MTTGFDALHCNAMPMPNPSSSPALIIDDTHAVFYTTIYIPVMHVLFYFQSDRVEVVQYNNNVAIQIQYRFLVLAHQSNTNNLNHPSDRSLQ